METPEQWSLESPPARVALAVLHSCTAATREHDRWTAKAVCVFSRAVALTALRVFSSEIEAKQRSSVIRPRKMVIEY